MNNNILCSVYGYAKSTLEALYENSSEIINFKLRTKIRNNEKLRKELSEVGYKPKKQVLEIKEVEIIFENLGTPILNNQNQELIKKFKLKIPQKDF